MVAGLGFEPRPCANLALPLYKSVVLTVKLPRRNYSPEPYEVLPHTYAPGCVQVEHDEEYVPSYHTKVKIETHSVIVVETDCRAEGVFRPLSALLQRASVGVILTECFGHKSVSEVIPR